MYDSTDGEGPPRPQGSRDAVNPVYEENPSSFDNMYADTTDLAPNSEPSPYDTYDTSGYMDVPAAYDDPLSGYMETEGFEEFSNNTYTEVAEA